MTRTAAVTYGRSRERGGWRLPEGLAKPHLAVMGLIFGGALVVGYLMLPDDTERIAMLERDGHARQALEILEQRFANGDRRHRTLFQMQGLYEEQGDLPRARAMLEMLASARPGDANLQRQLGEFYRMTQDEAGYVRTLEARLSSRYSQPVCRELIGLHRRAGNYEAEQDAIVRCRARGYRRTEDIVRLAHLTAADGNLAEAASLLRTVDDRRQLRGDSDRIMLFSALLEAGAADEAKRRAVRWFKGSKDDGLVLQMIDTLASEDRHALAIDLAREVGTPGDSISLSVAELMLDRDEIIAARAYLKGWLEASTVAEVELAQRALRAALEAEDPQLAYHVASQTGLKRLPQEDLVSLAEALSAVGATDASQKVRQEIEPGLLRENLLLSAAAEVEQGKPEPARDLLSRIEVKALDEWRLALWAKLMASTGRRATAEQTLREMSTEQQAAGARALPIALPAPVTQQIVPRPGSVAEAPPRRTPQVLRRGGGPQLQPGEPGPTAKLIRRGRPTLTNRVPRQSRLKRPPPPAALPKAPAVQGSSPFGQPG